MSRTWPSFAIVALLLCVAPALALVLPAPSSDTRELLSWGLHPSLSTPKQPPLMQWMGALVMRFAWPTTVWCVLLQQALNAAGLVYVYRILRRFQPREPAALLTVLLAGAVYFTGAPVAFALNADILQFPFWAALLFHALRAFETRAARHFAALALAFALAAKVSEDVVRLAIGLVALGFVVIMAVRDRLRAAKPTRADVAPGLFWGAIAGFASFVSHAGGPPFLVYTLPQRLSAPVFAGTSVLFFALVNLMKVPPYLWLGQFSRANLWASLTLLPLAILSTLAGVWIVRRVPAERFYNVVLAITFILGAKLIFDAVRALHGA